MKFPSLKTTSQVALFALGATFFASSVQASINVKALNNTHGVFDISQSDVSRLTTRVIQADSEQKIDGQPRLLTQKLTVRKNKKRVAKTIRGGLTISPSSARGDGYPTPGKAFEACGGAGNVFVMYDIGADGQTSNHSFHCVD